MRHAIVPLFLLLSSSSVLNAAQYYVATGGNDANAGSVSQPFATVQKALTRVVAGDTIYLRGGTYREAVAINGKAGSAAAPIVIAAYGNEKPVLKGSQIVTGWTLHGGTTWKRAGWTVNSQQVFADGAPLRQIGVPSSVLAAISYNGRPFLPPVGSGVSSMTPGSYHYDAAGKTLYVKLADGSNPANHMIEASTARRIVAMNANTSYVHLRNLSFRHSCASAFDAYGAAVELGNNCRMEQCDVQWCDFAGVMLGYKMANAQVVGCVLSNNGCVGLQGSSHKNFTVRDCVLADNNYRGFSPIWHAGGMKLTTQASGLVERNSVTNNRGVGIWFDWADSGNPLIVRGNYVYGNHDQAAGIMMEGSKAGVIANNIICGNDIRGIYISASDDMKVYNNTVCGTKGFAAIDVAGTPRAGKTLTNVRVFNNVVANNTAQDDIRIVKENGADIRNLSCDYNCVWRAGGIRMWWGLDGRGGWKGTRYTSMASWVAATPFSDHCKQADPQFTVGSGENYGLKSGSPAVNAGSALAESGTDYLGVNRPQGGSYDMGAFEYVVLPTAVAPPGTKTRIKVNFQPKGAPVPDGYLADDGAVYGAKTGGTYGWDVANGNARDRNAANASDQRYDTFNYLQTDGNYTWQIAVPNGKYSVRVVCGDPSYVTGNFKVNVEGVLTVNGVPTAASRWIEGTSTVMVGDGKLTLSNASGSSYNKVCFVEITGL